MRYGRPAKAKRYVRVKSRMRCASMMGMTRDPVLVATVAVGDVERLVREVREVLGDLEAVSCASSVTSTAERMPPEMMPAMPASLCVEGATIWRPDGRHRLGQRVRDIESVRSCASGRC